jgi:hypothetical protein
MNEVRMVCKYCGGNTFHAEVTVSGWINSTGVWLDDDGKPHFETDGHVEDTWSGDMDFDRYICSTCEKGSYRLAELVAEPPREGEAIAPCGRCDHGRAEHGEQSRWGTSWKDYYVRGAMPCEHEGCDCHDYYDVAIANAGQDPELLAAIGRAA